MTLPQVLEALLFASPKPMTMGEMRTVLKSTAEFTEEPHAAELARSREPEIRAALDALADGYRQQGRSIELSEGAAGWQLTTVASCAAWVRQLYPENRPARLSAPALETLAIIAYRQPVTRAEVESVRGVDAGGVVQTLLDRGLVHIAGRAEVAGRPLLYATTQFFLEHFGLKNVSELPAFEELKKSLADAENKKARNQPGAAEEPPAVDPGPGSAVGEPPAGEPPAAPPPASTGTEPAAAEPPAATGPAEEPTGSESPAE